MRTACITGASSGIGEEFAKQLAAKHYNLILVARSADKLDALAKKLRKKYAVSCEVIPCDLAQEDECLRLIRILKKRDLYLFINNAGFGDIGYFHETAQDKDLQMINVNVRALHLLAKEILADFVAKNRGYLLNVASIAGLMNGGPLMATYYATKSYVVSLTSSIAQELKMEGSDVHVSALCPGPVATNFDDVAGVSFSLKSISAARCVEVCLKQMNRGKLIIVPGFTSRLGAMLCHLAPRSLQLVVAAHAQGKKLS
ncbi:MAG: SDR family oxidoreductase [Lachnospiraceae bacterium]|nr:SDR family oxidoreductase [Lachnospiraceae bacterium]